MKAPAPPNLKETAWNGVCFKAPAKWEIGRIGLRYLLFETLDGPRLEIKWAPVKGRFSMQRQLKRLAGMQQRQVRKSFHIDRLPEQWRAVLPGYSATGFTWRGADLIGHGLLLYCPQCRTATLIQFYSRSNARPDPAAVFLLESFKDHGHTRLAVFDIKAELPDGFTLKDYRFNPGQFQLTFIGNRQTTVLHRWGPAAVLLRNQTLFEFARSRFDLKGHDVEWSDETVIEGGIRPRPSAARRFWNRLRKMPDYRWARIWCENDKNRLLGVDMSGRTAIDPEAFARLCGSYETI